MIRLGAPEDVPAVMDLLIRFHGEFGFAPMNREKVEREVEALIALSDLFLVDQGSIIGALGLVENVLWYGDGRFLSDRFFYVVPEHRGFHAEKMLRAAGKLEAERRNLPFVVVRHTGRRRGRVADLDGYSPVGNIIRL